MGDPSAPRSKKRKQEDDLEAIFKRKFQVKCRFRAVGRMVMANIKWLDEDDLDDSESDDVKTTVAKAIRRKSKRKQLLTLNDKALLNKPLEDRTEEEKSYLYRILGGLKCFRRYPAVVKEKLASVTYFKYWGPKRVIVRQGHEAHALYFLVSGEVGVSLNVFDDLLKQQTTLEVGLMTAGDMFGEVSLLHDIKRTATCTTNTDVEVLVLMKEDFKNILQATVEEEWNVVKQAMSKFTYFDALDEVSRREACLVAKMHSYLPSETILGDGVGIQNFVYFVVSGQCRIIEALQIIISKSSSQKTLYSLYTPKEEVVEEVEQYNYERIFKVRLTQSTTGQSGSNLVLPDTVSSDTSVTFKKEEGKSSAETAVEAVKSSLMSIVMHRTTSSSEAVFNKVDSVFMEPGAHQDTATPRKLIESTQSINSELHKISEKISQNMKTSETTVPKTSVMEAAHKDTANPSIRSKSSLAIDAEIENISKVLSEDIKTSESAVLKESILVQKEDQDAANSPIRKKSSLVSNSGSHKISQGSSENIKTSGSAALRTSFAEPPNEYTSPSPSQTNATSRSSTYGLDLRTYFMQVCLMNPGSCFGLGENMKGRRIVAVEAVNCLLLPRVWLFQRNTANIWSRIAHYLDRKVPSTKALFEEFVMGRRWEEFQTQMVDDIVESVQAVNWTTIHDVPYSIRIEEDIDI